MCLREPNCHFHRSLSKTEMEVVAIGKTTVALLLHLMNYFRAKTKRSKKFGTFEIFLKNVVASEWRQKPHFFKERWCVKLFCNRFDNRL